MARLPRIEFPDACYHVLCRGDRREPIFEDDGDRRTFLRTLDEVCERSAWRIFAWVLMPNHYHFVLQTPQANLVAGMKWFQNTYTRRYNTRHKSSGHLFGGRYKAILVEATADGYMEALIDYVHLNPVRAGLIGAGKGLLDFPWSSLACGYGVPVAQRASWLAVVEGLGLLGFRDDARDRRRYVERLEKRAQENATGPQQELRATLQRGWYWGTQQFREKMLSLSRRGVSNRTYRSSALGHQLDRRGATIWIEKAMRHFDARDVSPREADRPVRLAAAWALHHRSNQPQAWIADQLALRSAANVSQQVRRIDSANPPPWSKSTAWKQWKQAVKNASDPASAPLSQT